MNMRSALRLIPLMAIGAVAAFLLAGPLTSLYKTHAVASRAPPSASFTIDPHASPTRFVHDRPPPPADVVPRAPADAQVGSNGHPTRGARPAVHDLGQRAA